MTIWGAPIEATRQGSPMRPLLPAALFATSVTTSLAGSGVACSRNQGNGSDAAHGSAAPSDASAGGGIAVAAAAVPPPAPPRPPSDVNVVLLTIDSLRADMPWSGYPRPIAPRLTELAARSVSYTRAYAVSSYTSMSLGGLLGGKL